MDTDIGEHLAERQSRLRVRRRGFVAIAGTALVAALAGILVSPLIKSPAQVDAEVTPPAPTVLTVPVSQQVVTSTVLAQGVVSEPAEFSGPVSFGAASAGGSSAGATMPVVTRILVSAGSEVSAGTVLAEVAGRPLFVFAGPVPVYRDLTVGQTGQDVAQLQAGLKALGYSTGADQSGTFGAGTSAAVTAYYRAIGYGVPVQVTPASTGQPATTTVTVPATEFMFVPQLPATVVSYSAAVGQLVSGPLVTLAMGSPVIDGQLNPADQGLVRPGMGVQISAEGSAGAIGDGTVASVATAAQSANSIAGGSYVGMGVTPAVALPVSMVGQDVQLTITAAHSAGAVLAVPVAGVFAGPDGATYVTKVTARGAQVRVEVRVGVIGDGEVEVTPLGGATLSPGDRVVTGENYARLGNSGTGGLG
ncbi:MAG: peptidoglycan-binding protein [Streptosporangiaceae bacterium]